MSYSTYAPNLTVPDAFPDILTELTTEILKTQPEDATGIYQAAYHFFLKKQEQGDGEGEESKPSEQPAE